MELENGRAAYSLESLRTLNQTMASHHCDVHQARKIAFGIDDDWKPPLPALDNRTGHPTVDQNLTYVRKFIMSAIRTWGMPQSVNIEHVRDAFLGPTALEEQRRENNRRANERERAKKNLPEELGQEVSRRNIRRHEYIQRQNSKCAYCETTITLHNCELDHIVPRTGGGATNRGNLVAACRDCNARKGNRPFAIWARDDPRMDANGEKLISVEKTKKMVRSWLPSPRPTPAERTEIRDLLHRVSQKTEDEAIDERSMESTAYAALQIRDRVQSFLYSMEKPLSTDAPSVRVYRGALIADARRASGIHGLIYLRDKDIKDRGDFRHHAIDACVIAMMEPSVAQTLNIKHKMRMADEFAGSEPQWKDFSGRTPGARETFAAWHQKMHSLASAITEGINNDAISVQNPLRLNRRVGAVHEETILPLTEKPVDSEWSPADIKKIVDPQEYLLFADASQGKKLSKAPDNLLNYFAELDRDTVELFSASAAQIAVRGGGAKLGSIHHARLLAWRDKKGNIKFGMQRIFAGEIAKMWPDQSTDILTADVPRWSMSYRDLQSGVLKAVEAGEAKHIGWIAAGDEIELDVDHFLKGSNQLSQALQEMPEKRWSLVGFNDNSRAKISPLYLSSEAQNVTPNIRTALDGRLMLSVGELLPNMSIIRRNPLGLPGYRSKHTANSFRPATVAESVL